MSEIFVTQTKLTALGKKGEIKPSDDGYYTLVLGGLETSNNMGSWYYAGEEAIKKLFEPGSLLSRRIQNGCVRAEVGHPKMRSDESMDAFCNRMLDIDLNNACAHIRKVWLDTSFGKNHPEYKNPNLIAIMGEVKPEGGRGFILKEMLENNSANVCFSIRSIADETMVRGKRYRKLEQVITFDLVNEGGIVVASKWDSPACESAQVDEALAIKLTEQIIERAKRRVPETAAFESSSNMLNFVDQTYFKKPAKDSIYKRW